MSLPLLPVGPPGFTPRGPSSIGSDRFARAAARSVHEAPNPLVPRRSDPRRRRPPSPAQGPDGGERHAPDGRCRHPPDLRPARLPPDHLARRLRDQDPQAAEHCRDAASGLARSGLRRCRLGAGAGGRAGRAGRYRARSRAHRGRGRARLPRRRSAGDFGLRGRDRIRADHPRLAGAARLRRAGSSAPMGLPRCSRPRTPTASSTTPPPAPRSRPTAF